jgi:hypothetical protein
MKSGSRDQGRTAVVGFESGPLLMIRALRLLGQVLSERTRLAPSCLETSRRERSAIGGWTPYQVRRRRAGQGGPSNSRGNFRLFVRSKDGCSRGNSRPTACERCSLAEAMFGSTTGETLQTNAPRSSHRKQRSIINVAGSAIVSGVSDHALPASVARLAAVAPARSAQTSPGCRVRSGREVPAIWVRLDCLR